MKLKENFVLRQVANTWVILPLAEQTVNFSGMLKLNDSGAFLWKVLEQGADRDGLTDALTREYDVSRCQAETDVDLFLEKLLHFGCVQE